MVVGGQVYRVPANPPVMVLVLPVNLVDTNTRVVSGPWPASWVGRAPGSAKRCTDLLTCPSRPVIQSAMRSFMCAHPRFKHLDLIQDSHGCWH